MKFLQILFCFFIVFHICAFAKSRKNRKSDYNSQENLSSILQKYKRPYVEDQIIEPFQSKEATNDIFNKYFNDMKKYELFLNFYRNL